MVHTPLSINSDRLDASGRVVKVFVLSVIEDHQYSGHNLIE